MTLRLYAELNDHVGPAGPEIEVPVDGEVAVGTVIESCGVPLAEVDLILVAGGSVGPDHRVGPGDRVGVYPVFETFDVGTEVKLRSRPLRVTRFLVDPELTELADLLGAGGYDTIVADRPLTAPAGNAGRIVLTRDPDVISTRGLVVRADTPREQHAEVVDRLQLG